MRRISCTTQQFPRVQSCKLWIEPETHSLFHLIIFAIFPEKICLVLFNVSNKYSSSPRSVSHLKTNNKKRKSFHAKFSAYFTTSVVNSFRFICHLNISIVKYNSKCWLNKMKMKMEEYSYAVQENYASSKAKHSPFIVSSV